LEAGLSWIYVYIKQFIRIFNKLCGYKITYMVKFATIID
jgi:hypothetical protein